MAAVTMENVSTKALVDSGNLLCNVIRAEFLWKLWIPTSALKQQHIRVKLSLLLAALVYLVSIS